MECRVVKNRYAPYMAEANYRDRPKFEVISNVAVVEPVIVSGGCFSKKQKIKHKHVYMLLR